MATTIVEMNEVLLEQARVALGAATESETVHMALREVVRHRAGTELLDLLRGDAVEIRDPSTLRRLNWHDSPGSDRQQL